jgi:hypothetical protein
MAPHLTGDGAIRADLRVAVGDEVDVRGVEEAVLEYFGEVVHHEVRRGRAQRLVVEGHGHLPVPRRGDIASTDQQEESREWEEMVETSGHGVRTMGRACSLGVSEGLKEELANGEVYIGDQREAGWPRVQLGALNAKLEL